MLKERILVIDDDASISKLVSDVLTEEGFSVITASCGEEGIKKVHRSKPNLIILDLRLPDMNGFQICQTLKKDKNVSDIPIIMLTVKSTKSSTVAGLEMGADDYIVKPFNQEELIARVKTVLRRTGGGEKVEEILRYGDILLNLDKHAASLKDKEIDLTPMEFNLLHILIKKKGHVLNRNFLLETVWGYEYFGTTRTVDVHIGRLREKLAPLGEKIETVEGVGYKLVDEGRE
ncbi:response regulator transcription factor [bacterium]|jgi:two-component system alkaline phosphatase synthesis response regulator PhoP|nr:response regulator transcription factor [bacterium]